MALQQPDGVVDPQLMLQQIQQQRIALQKQQPTTLSGFSGSLQGGPLPHQQLAQVMGGGGAAALPGQRGSWQNRNMSIASEETFGRAMSGLSALSIDWENMEDFDVNVDYSAQTNNDMASGGVAAGGASSGVDDGIMEGCAMSGGGACTCGPSCVCVGCPLHDQATALPNFADGGAQEAGSRRLSLKKSIPTSSNGNSNAPVDPTYQVSFKV